MRLSLSILLMLTFQVVVFSATIYVPGDYPTIQEAIDAAANGDIIQVSAGDYTEQLTVDGKEVEILGAGINQTRIISPPILDTTFVTSADNKCVVGIINGGKLNIQRLTVDGQGLGNSNYRFVGIGFRNSGGAVLYCKIIDIQDTPFSGAQHGVGIYAYNNDGINRDIFLKNCTVIGYQKTAIALNGPDIYAILAGCFTLGAGQTSITAQNGIQLAYGTSGIVDNCSVYGNCYTGASWTATGILLYDGGVVDVLNSPIIKDNQTGVYYITTDGCFFNNKLTAGINAQGGDQYYYGLGIDDQGTHGPAVSLFGDGKKAKNGRSQTTVTVAESLFDADQTGSGIGIGAWAQSGDNVLVKIVDCEVTDWAWGIDVWDDGTATATVDVNQCDISGNTQAGINNDTTDLVSAEYNWWGDPTGPYHPTLNPDGIGDAVTDNVSFDPWLTGAESLTADSYILHASKADTIDFTLEAGIGCANRNYFLLGSASGMEPGLPLPGGEVLPLNWDAFTGIIFQLANTPALANFYGTLDGTGSGTAQMNTFGQLPPTSLGFKMYFAYLLYYPFDFVSNPVAIEIVP